MSDSSDDSTLPPIDPRDDVVLPPWIWLTLCTLSLFCLLFISFRRAKSLELYERARDYLQAKLPFSRPRGIRLTEHDLEASSWSHSRPPPPTSSSSSSSSSSLHSSDEDEADELPTSPPSPRTASLESARRKGQSMVSSASDGLTNGATSLLKALRGGWGDARGGGRGRGRGRGGGGEERAVGREGDLGLLDRAGGVRRGGGGGGGWTRGGREAEVDDERGGGGGGGVMARVTDLAGRRASGPPPGGHGRSGSTSSAAAMFEVGEEDDAVELPAHFELGEPPVDRAAARAMRPM
ncbi:hypothetical protein JCM1840_005075 [Sporobolomyces johnsonii]